MCPSNTHMLNPDAQHGRIWRSELWEVGSEGGTFINEIIAFIKETPESSVPSAVQGDSEK